MPAAGTPTAAAFSVWNRSCSWWHSGSRGPAGAAERLPADPIRLHGRPSGGYSPSTSGGSPMRLAATALAFVFAIPLAAAQGPVVQVGESWTEEPDLKVCYNSLDDEFFAVYTKEDGIFTGVYGQRLIWDENGV